MNCCLCGKDIDNSIYKKCTKCSGRGSTRCQFICTTCYAKRGTCNDCFGLENNTRSSAAAIGSATATAPARSSVNQSLLSTSSVETSQPQQKNSQAASSFAAAESAQASVASVSFAADEQQQSNSQAASSFPPTEESIPEVVDAISVHQHTAEQTSAARAETEHHITSASVQKNQTVAEQQSSTQHHQQEGISIYFYQTKLL